ncbi:MAG: hypothetical protein IT463_04040 [Planctomycetes bacterium]|nr:hypothetical protein [Planctomycetota bacterium]
MTEAAATVTQPGQRSPLVLAIRQATLVFLAAFALGLYLQTNPGPVETEEGTEWSWQRNHGIPFGDGYYHIKIAYLYRTGDVWEAGKDFHWTRESTWNGQFSDKDFLYHMLLVPFTLGARDELDAQALLNGAQFSAPFFLGLLAVCLWSALRLLGVKRPWFWCLFALAVCGTSFLGRTVEPRSWMPGVSLALLGWAFLSRGSRKGVFVVGTLYALAYTGCHLLVAMAGFRLVVGLVIGAPKGSTRKVELVKDLLLLVSAMGGIALGCLLHPNSIELLKLWWVQNVLVLHLYQHGTLEGTLEQITGWVMGWQEGQTAVPIPRQAFGGELHSPRGMQLLEFQTYVIAIPIALPLLAAVSRVRVTREALIGYGLALVFVAMNYRVHRFTEYAVPFLVVAAALWLPAVFVSLRAQAVIKKTRVGSRFHLPVAATLLVLVGGYHTWQVIGQLGAFPFSYFPEVGDWLQANDEVRGKVIYNHSWDSFPELFFYRADCDYIAGLDPVYASVTATDNARTYLKLIEGKVGEVASDGPALVRRIQDDFGADYIFVHRAPDATLLNGLAEAAKAGHLEPLVQRPGYALYRIPKRK